MKYKIQVEYTLNPKKIAHYVEEEIRLRPWHCKPTSAEEMFDYLDDYYTDELIADHYEIDFCDLDDDNKKLIACLVWNEYQEIILEEN